MVYELRVLRAEELERSRFVLRPGRYTVGSAPGADILLRDSHVSRRHAQLEIGSEGVTVRDLGSKNGTFIEGQRATAAVVLPGQEIRFGSVTCRLDTAEQDEGPVLLAPARGADALRPEVEGPAPSTVRWTAYLDDVAKALSAATDPTGRDHCATTTAGTLLAALAEGGGFGGLRLESGSVEAPAVLAHAGVVRTAEDAGVVLAKSAGLRLRAWAPPPAAPAARFFWQVVLALLALALGGAGPPRSGPASGSPSAPPRAPLTADPRMRELLATAARLARSDVPILIEGESGTGKEVLARWIHDTSPRASGPFVALNCAALPRELQEAELFGVESGVATGVASRPGLLETAKNGTVLLDDIPEMPPELQAKLLRALQERQVLPLGARRPRPIDVRFLATSNRSLREQVARRVFRRDLFHRIAGVTLEVPPLRERVEDIVLLSGHFLERECRRLGFSSPGLTVAALRALAAYDWPGNVRELEHEMTAVAARLEPGEVAGTAHLSPHLRAESHAVAAGAPPPLSLEESVQRAKADAIRRALRISRGDPAAAAALLGVSRSTLYRTARSLGIEVGRDGPDVPAT